MCGIHRWLVNIDSDCSFAPIKKIVRIYCNIFFLKEHQFLLLQNKYILSIGRRNRKLKRIHCKLYLTWRSCFTFAKFYKYWWVNLPASQTCLANWKSLQTLKRNVQNLETYLNSTYEFTSYSLSNRTVLFLFLLSKAFGDYHW